MEDGNQAPKLDRWVRHLVAAVAKAVVLFLFITFLLMVPFIVYAALGIEVKSFELITTLVVVLWAIFITVFYYTISWYRRRRRLREEAKSKNDSLE